MSSREHRPIVLGLVLGVHGLVGYVLLRSTLLAHRPESIFPDVEPTSASFLESRSQRVLPTPDSAPSPPPLHTPQFRDPSLPDIPPIQLNTEPDTSAITDWSAEAHAAAADVLERARQKSGEHSSARGSADMNGASKPGVFGSEKQNHRAGMVEDGTRYWVSDNCYYDFPRGFPPSRMAGEFHLATPTCKPAPTGGGDKMFEDLKPGYLRNPPQAPTK